MTKLALHIQSWQPAALDSVLYCNAPLLKVMAPDVDPIRAAIDARPDLTLVIRRYFNDGEQRQYLDSVESGGIAVAELVAEQYAPVLALASERRITVYAEGLNEIGLWDDADRYNAFTVGFANACGWYGMLPAVYSFATGNPPGYETPAGLDLESYWAHYYDGLRAAGQAQGALALHEYSAPSMQDKETWLCLRYRRVYAFLPADCRLPLLVTETGIDGGVIGAPSAAAAGWTNYASADEYAAQLRWYDGEISRDPQVLGATVFLAGNADIWTSFDVTGVQPVLNAIREGGTVPPAIPTVITAVNRPAAIPGETVVFTFRASGIDGQANGFVSFEYPLMPGTEYTYGPPSTTEIGVFTDGDWSVNVFVSPNMTALPDEGVDGELRVMISELNGTPADPTIDGGNFGPFPIDVAESFDEEPDDGDGYASADERAALDELWALAGGYRAQTPPDVHNADYIEQRVIRIKHAHGIP